MTNHRQGTFRNAFDCETVTSSGRTENTTRFRTRGNPSRAIPDLAVTVRNAFDCETVAAEKGQSKYRSPPHEKKNTQRPITDHAVIFRAAFDCETVTAGKGQEIPPASAREKPQKPHQRRPTEWLPFSLSGRQLQVIKPQSRPTTDPAVTFLLLRQIRTKSLTTNHLPNGHYEPRCQITYPAVTLSLKTGRSREKETPRK